MGRKLDVLLGRKAFKTAKFKSLLGMAVSRIAVFKNKNSVRCVQARNDVAQLLSMAGQQERALLRVEQVIKEQNMLDVFLVLEGYCNLLIERVALVENNKECPGELREAIAGLIFAAARCGEFPELLEVRQIFTSRFGKEFTESAAELRNNCGVNPKLIQKLSTRQPSTESKTKVLKEIALENGITLNLAEASEIMVEELNLNQNQNQNQITPKPKMSADVGGNEGSSVKSRPDDKTSILSDLDRDEQFSGSMKTKKKYADVASAAQAAFESAAYAAAAARAAVELSRSESQGRGSDDQSSPRTHKRFDEGSSRSRSRIGERHTGIATEVEVEHLGSASGFQKIHPVQNSSSESEPEEMLVKPNRIRPENFRGKHRAQLERSASSSSSDSVEVSLEVNEMTSHEADWTKPSENAAVFDESDDETENKQGGISRFKQSELGPSPRGRKHGISGERTGDRFPKNNQFSGFSEEEFLHENEGSKLHYPFQKQNQRRPQADTYNSLHQQNQKVGMGSGIEDDVAIYYAEGRRSQAVNAHLDAAEKLRTEHSKVEKKPTSVRTRRGL